MSRWSKLFAKRVGRRGSVGLVAAMMLPVMVGMTGLGAEYAYALMQQSYDQRVADIAAYGGALAYSSTNTTSNMTAAVTQVAALNGIPSGNVSSQIVNSPTGDGNSAVQVTISTTAPLIVSTIFGANNSVAVSASSYVELSGGTSGCIYALNSAGTGVTLSGGTSVTATSCKVTSNATVTVPCGTTIKAKEVDYNSSTAPSVGCSGIENASGTAMSATKKSTSDPLAGTTYITTLTGHVTAVATQSSPGAPSAGSGTGNINPGYSAPYSVTGLGACTFTFASNTWTVTCPAGTYNIGSLTLGGGLSMNFNTSGSSASVYNFNGSITNSGATLNFGPGTYNVAQGITTGGGSTTTFGAGTFNIGASTSACNGAGKYSICNTGTSLTFGGPSTFKLTAGIYNTGGSTLTMGSGTTNSYWIGASSDGNAFYNGGGAKMTLADATGSGDLFQVSGTVNVSSGGGSCLTLPAASAHDINGSFTSAGGSTLGAGVYTINGYFALGANGGGDVTCNGSSVGLNGNGVTLVISASTTLNSGTCSGMAFCVAAGFGHVTLVAPSSSSTTSPQLAVIGPTSSSNTAGATFAEGATATSISGVFYLPYGAITLSGGASVGGGTGQCLELVGSQVTLSGGTAVSSTCTSAGGSSGSSTIALVQ